MSIFLRNIVLGLVVVAVASLCASPASAALVNHWKFDETSDTVADDAMDNQDGTLVNGGVWFPTGGKVDGCLYLNNPVVGSEYQWVSAGVGTIPADNFTIMGWVKANSINLQRNLVFAQYADLARGRFQTGLYNKSGYNGTTMAYQSRGVSSDAIIAYGPRLNVNQWYHIAYVKSGSTCTGYLNGNVMLVLNDMVDVPALYTGLGGQADQEGHEWDGWLDDFRIYDTALTEEEIDVLIEGLVEVSPGDANLDGNVDDGDAAILATYWLQSGPSIGWEQGDFTGDHIVNDVDATLMATNWQGAAGTAVSEPSTVVLLLGGILAFFMARRK